MRLSAGLSTRERDLGQRDGITHALKLVAKCKAWCGCMSCTGEMKTRTAPAQLVQPLACWPERLALSAYRYAAAVLPTARAEWSRNTARQAELTLEPRRRKGRREGEAMSGGEQCGSAARHCVSFDDEGPLAATLRSCLRALPLLAIQPCVPPGIDQPIRPIDSDISPLTRSPGTGSWTRPTGGVRFETLQLTTQRASLWQGVNMTTSRLRHTRAQRSDAESHAFAAVLPWAITRGYHGLSQEATVHSSLTERLQPPGRSDARRWRVCEVTALHAHRTHAERRLPPHRTRSESWSALFTVQMQKECGSAALSKRREMQEHRRAACRLKSPAAADLPGDGESLDPAALRTATQRWCDIAERELHLATARFPRSRLKNGRNQGTMVSGTGARGS
ncbi:uncharacterized protein M421DRAFT_95462 [Didymella exigua CBS 183.55]|uniref:Uncharacterized protein n=1 Tax=Didymella exigua CBS 183.55 TaxID=1150837 RepID=A0A6A5R9E4_9PLEO|nr:uncharacterized protein M421DRAFT_95462 [Didymella exigua CBS 183.55]KAF1924362.1 hypothetical protein M421DRAFT_95462 [Didymella exigua CBS 183.55]